MKPYRLNFNDRRFLRSLHIAQDEPAPVLFECLVCGQFRDEEQEVCGSCGATAKRPA